jgi:hypothetical protein
MYAGCVMMRMMKVRRRLLLLIVALVASSGGHAARADDAVDLARVRAFVAANHQGKVWDVGPTRMATPELRAAYPRLRFYYVYSGRPMPPGANIEGMQRQYQKSVDAQRAMRLSLTMSVDERGEVRPLESVADLDRGLTRPRTEEQRRSVAAAIASLQFVDFSGPQPMGVDAVTVVERDGQRRYVVTAPGQISVVVLFDSHGRCVAADAAFHGSLPPSSARSPAPPPPNKSLR